MNYFDYPAVSNSKISEFERKIFNLYKPDLEKVYEFGSLVHQLVLEPSVAVPTATQLLTSEDIANICRMREVALKHKLLSWLLQFSQKEVEVYWQDSVTGLPLKSKIDILHKENRIVADLKTTSATTQKAFESSVKKFGYNRQAAFYSDAVGAHRFIFIGIQKVAPFRVFQFEVPEDDVIRGRMQYRKLLNKAHQMGYFNHLFEEYIP